MVTKPESKPPRWERRNGVWTIDVGPFACYVVEQRVGNEPPVYFASVLDREGEREFRTLDAAQRHCFTLVRAMARQARHDLKVIDYESGC